MTLAEKLAKVSQVNRKFEALTSTLRNAELNVRQWGHLEAYKGTYESEIKKIQGKIDGMIQEYPYLAKY